MHKENYDLKVNLRKITLPENFFNYKKNVKKISICIDKERFRKYTMSID
jgi:hypothetical protein